MKLGLTFEQLFDCNRMFMAHSHISIFIQDPRAPFVNKFSGSPC